MSISAVQTDSVIITPVGGERQETKEMGIQAADEVIEDEVPTETDSRKMEEKSDRHDDSPEA